MLYVREDSRERKKLNLSYGTGYYQVDNKDFWSHGVSIPRTGRRRRESGDRECSLGPGHYDTTTIFDNANKGRSFGLGFSSYRKVSFPGCDRENLGRSTDRVGIVHSDLLDLRHGTSFPRSARKEQRSQSLPGPGQYEPYLPPRTPRTVPFGESEAKQPRLDFDKLRPFQRSLWGFI